MSRRGTLLAVLAVVLAACASSERLGDARPHPRSADRITQEEIRQTRVPNAFELVQALRPNWLAFRGAQSFNDPTAGRVVVYLDGNRAGGAEYLREVSTTLLARLEFLNATDASARYGLNHTGGAILLFSLP